jgi:hypothetical protein
MTLFLVLLLTADLPGDIRIRTGFSWPSPRGIEESYWAGNGVCCYQRFRLNPNKWNIVLLTEKDRGEEWADLVTGGLQFTENESFSVTAGAVSVQFAQGLLLSHSGSWGTADPFSLSKPRALRVRIEPAESPGPTDGTSLTGAGSQYFAGGFSAAAVLCWSSIDPGETGLHRSSSEIASHNSVNEKLVAFRTGYGPAGISFAGVRRTADSTETDGSRIGADLYLEGEHSLLTGEFVTDLDSISNFVLSGTRGTPDLRHGLTLSRSTGSMPRTSGSFGTEHNIGTGYGIRWRISDKVLIDGGVLFLDCPVSDKVKAGIQFTESPASRTEFSQRLSFSGTGDEQTVSGRITASWSPGSDMVLSMKMPFAHHRSDHTASETGYGLEARLRHILSTEVEYSVSAAACSTDGWNSRVYAYSLSFPGEFGSTALYNSTVLLQGAVSLHISSAAVLRARCAWYNMEGEESLGSGWEETDGSCRTEAGLQLDWNFE